MLNALSARHNASAVPLTLVAPGKWDAWLDRQTSSVRDWLRANEFTAAPGAVCLLPDRSGALVRAVAGVGAPLDIWEAAAISKKLPAGRFVLDTQLPADQAGFFALGWALAAYRFDRYKSGAKSGKPSAVLEWPKKCDRKAVERAALGTGLVRDLANTPASDLGPAELAKAARKVARAHKADCMVTVGDSLLKKNYPLKIGRAHV